ncbi:MULTISPECIES: hypothetical protein [Prochlorococcus]|uniref:hypothetical protein n=1 Tax=Prochlorococcus TaxID=1218 RepID=UPI0002E6DF88|nr:MULTISPECIES: hypothetical protein [Prochlorococcus]KGG13409.1 hypothetical protein EV04_0644 [Prochlorococcus marinus str. LG]KGG21347.1 hypothetical protein EV08_0755 [Prochlorococcus marinus str. SS2]KGG24321.1 hypothetical protein EV09_0368 [Prochlorococcus marinus str. SS35]KGG33605.1 hypothetical protein EV10_0445 [Prochlorococcus marinus str. SS51]KGG36479.1 hypothetical protein EV11_0851 [Prochlorococcus sp. SS52]
MKKNEIEIAMEGLFLGAERVRSKKHANRLSKNVHREFSSRIVNELWEEQRKKFKAA